MSRRVAAVVFAVLVFVMLPRIAHAQSAIVGVAKDTSGAVLPGVTVAASSDVLRAARSSSRPASGCHRCGR